jgi:hypothetical protein
LLYQFFLWMHTWDFLWSKANIYIGIRCSRQTQSWFWPRQRLQKWISSPYRSLQSCGTAHQC